MMASVVNDTTEVNARDGALYNYSRLESREIEVAVTAVTDNATSLASLKRQLAGLLYTKEPQMLVFSDDPEFYYMAKLSDDSEIEQIGGIGQGTLTFICPDAYMYKKELTTITNVGDSGNTNLLSFSNAGTAGSPPVMEVEFESENGVIAFINQDGKTVQIGNTEEIDGYTEQLSVLLFDDHFYEDKGWLVNQGVTPPVTWEQKQVGKITYTVDQWNDPIDPNEGYARVVDFGTGTSWHGGAITKEIPVDANGKLPVNWKSSFRLDFNNDGVPVAEKGSRIGHSSVTYSDAEGNVVASVVFEDNTVSKESIDFVLYVEGKRVYDKRNTSQTWINNRAGKTAWTTVEKMGNDITFSINFEKITETYKLENPDTEITHVTWYSAAYQDHTNIANSVFRALQVVKHNVDHWVDLQNTFQPKDKLRVDFATGEIFYNEVFSGRLGAIGNEFFDITNGENEIYIITSSFAETPKVTMTYREAYL